MNAMNPKRRALVATLLAGMVVPVAARSPARPSYTSRADVQQFVDELVDQHGFDRTRLEQWLNAARYSETVERLMQPPIPFGQRTGLDYRARYLDDRRVQAGAAFWRANRAAPHGNAITGYGFGTDVNGLGDQANPRPDAAAVR